MFRRTCTEVEAERAPVVCDTSDGVDRSAVNRDLVATIDRFVQV